MRKVMLVLILAVFPAPSQNALPEVSIEKNFTVSDTARRGTGLIPVGSYSTAKASVERQRLSLQTEWRGTDSQYARAKKLLEESVVNTLIPFWYGTPWEFYGHTSVPKKGTIACGYFVSTVLLHAGFSINRYTIAQQAPYYEALTYAAGDSVTSLSGDFASFSREFRSRFKEGLYFAGLSCHVGFLLFNKDGLFFIHSSYMDPVRVICEKAGESAPFLATDHYWITPLSNNRTLIDRWVRGVAVATKTP